MIKKTISFETFTAKEVQEIFKISAVTLWKWDTKGLTNPVQVQKRKVYLQKDILQLIEEKTRKAS